VIELEDLSEFCNRSVAELKSIADRLLSTNDLYVTYSYSTYHRGRREIVVPVGLYDTAMKNLHRSLNTEMPYRAPDHVHGFVKGRSTFTNASCHLSQPCVLRVDLQEFFPSIDIDRVERAFREQGMTREAANLCARLTTIDGRLPVGISTSPMISNLVFSATDSKLARFTATARINFTRYVDDLIFSGEVDNGTLERVQQIVNDDGWTVNRRKTHFMRRGGPQYVTGLYVGCSDRPRIPRRIKRQLRRIIYLIEQFGYDTYMQEFGGNEAGMVPRRLHGWAQYIASVEPDVGYPLLRTLSAHIPDPGQVRPQQSPVGLIVITDVDQLGLEP
jgi:hypothetical protein